MWSRSFHRITSPVFSMFTWEDSLQIYYFCSNYRASPLHFPPADTTEIAGCLPQPFSFTLSLRSYIRHNLPQPSIILTLSSVHSQRKSLLWRLSWVVFLIPRLLSSDARVRQHKLSFVSRLSKGWKLDQTQWIDVISFKHLTALSDMKKSVRNKPCYCSVLVYHMDISIRLLHFQRQIFDFLLYYIYLVL